MGSVKAFSKAFDVFVVRVLFATQCLPPEKTKSKEGPGDALYGDEAKEGKQSRKQSAEFARLLSETNNLFLFFYFEIFLLILQLYCNIFVSTISKYILVCHIAGSENKNEHDAQDWRENLKSYMRHSNLAAVP